MCPVPSFRAWRGLLPLREVLYIVPIGSFLSETSLHFPLAILGGQWSHPIYSSKCRLPLPAHRHRLLTEAMSGTGHDRYWLTNRRLASGLRRAWHRESQRWRTAPHKHWRSGSTVVCSLCTEYIYSHYTAVLVVFVHTTIIVVIVVFVNYYRYQ